MKNMEVIKYAGNTQNGVLQILYTWTIDNFTLLTEMSAHCGLKSPTFPNDTSGIKFFMELQPSKSSDSDFLFVGITPIKSQAKKNKYKVSISILNSPSSQKSFLLGCYQSCTVGLINWEQLFNEKDTLLPNDNLKISCEIIMLKTPENYCERLNKVIVPKCQLAEDFGNLLNQENFHDVTIETGDGRKISANRFILSARSKVFAAMFRHPLEESQLNCVTISDFNYEVISEMLRFIYTGQAPNLEDVVEDLIGAADKYELDRLKAMCASCLSEKLSIETAAITLQLSDVYNVEELKSESIEFIKSHAQSVSETSNWKKLISTDRNILIEYFVESVLHELKLNDDIKKYA